MKDRFQPGSGTYVCGVCGKQTRETGYGESDSRLCASCFRISEWENALSDGVIDEAEFERITEEIKKEYKTKEERKEIFEIRKFVNDKRALGDREDGIQFFDRANAEKSAQTLRWNHRSDKDKIRFIVEKICEEGKILKNNFKKSYNKNKEDIMNTDQLRKAAVDLNKTLGLEPKIDTRLPKEELTKKVTKAGAMLEDGDKIEQNTFDVLAELEVDIPAGVKKVKAPKAGTDSGEKKEAKPKAGKEKAEKKESAAMNEFGFRVGSALGYASEAIAEGKSKEAVIKIIIKNCGSEESAAEGRYKIALRELKKQGVVK